MPTPINGEYAIDPTQTTLFVNLSTYGFEEGATVTLQLNGDIRLSANPFIEFYQDIYQISHLWYNGVQVAWGTPLTLTAGTTVEIRNFDTRYDDNSDPDGDYKITFAGTNPDEGTPGEKIPDEIENLYRDSSNLSDDAKEYLDEAMEYAFTRPGEIDLATRLQLTLNQLTTARENGDTSADLRDAEYYMHGLYASAAGDLPHGLYVAGAPVYNAWKGLLNTVGLGDLTRANPNNPNAPPGGSRAAYEGLVDGLRLDGDVIYDYGSFTAPNLDLFF